MSALAEPDAAMYWRSLGANNDQFLLYAFPASNSGDGDAVAELRSRAVRIADLHLGIARTPNDLDYPRWVPVPIVDDQFCVHTAATWDDCLRAVAGFMGQGSLVQGSEGEGRRAGPLWRVHVFAAITGAPEAVGPATVVVLQISHALGDGRRVSDLARRLLSDEKSEHRDRDASMLPSATGVGIVADIAAAMVGVATVLPRLAAATVVGLLAWRSEQPPAGLPVIEATPLNLPADGAVELRTITVSRDGLRRYGPSVTVSVMAVLAHVLAGVGGATSEGQVVAEVTLARPPTVRRRNNFHTVAVDLHAEAEVADRAGLIGDQIERAQRRDGTTARRLERKAAGLVPAVLASLAVRLGRRAPLPTHVAGATVVSSVNRGPADLMLGGRRVLFTAGFPALSPVHGLTHGVHGIGDRITVSIAATGHAAAVVDDYERAVAAALRR